jgi:hypothetical protein
MLMELCEYRKYPWDENGNVPLSRMRARTKINNNLIDITINIRIFNQKII